MKRIVASIGAAAIGSTVLHAQAVYLSPQERTKPWSVSVALRGFYDSNYLLATRDSSSIPESFGFEVRPTVGLNSVSEQTYVGFDVTYAGQWYADDNHWDNSVLFDGIVNHSFTEQVNLEVSDTFVYSDRPELTDPSLSTIIRTDQDNINNRGNVQLSVGISPRLGVVVGYQNLFWNYQEDNPAADTVPPFSPSLSALLNRMQQLIPVTLRHQTGPQTVTFIGYNFGMVNYSSDEYLYDSGLAAGGPATGTGPRADTRDNRSQYGYLGVEHNFTPLLNLGVKGGVQYTTYYNDPLTDSNITPYGDITLGYIYTTGSRAEIGYNLAQGATSVYEPSASGQVTQNRLVSSLFARVYHQFLPQLHGNLFGEWQLSDYNGGAYDGTTQNYYSCGVSLNYDFNRFLAANVGYAFDYQDNAIPSQAFTRNRVYLGLTASY